MGRLTKLRESLFGISKPETPKVTTKAIVNEVKQDFGVSPSKSFAALQEYFKKDSLIYTAVAHMAMETARPIKISGDENYNIRIDGKTTVEYLENWCQRVNLDGRIALIAMELIAYGNSFLRLMSDGTIQSIPLVGIEKPVGVNKTTPVYEKYNLQMLATYGGDIIPYEEFIHFRTMYYSDDPFGHGIIEPLLLSTNSDAPSLMTMREKLRIAMTNLALKAGAPTEYVTGELTDDDVDTLSNALKDIPYWGRRAVLNKDVKITTSILPRSGLIDAWNELVEMELFAALGDPILRLTTQPGFTEASSKTAEAMHQKRIDFYQRVIKRGLEQLFYRLLEKSAYDPDKAKIKVEFVNEVETVEEPKPIKKGEEHG